MPVVAVTTVVTGLGEAEFDQAQAGVTPRVVDVAEQPPVVVTVVHARRVDQPCLSADPLIRRARCEWAREASWIGRFRSRSS